MSSLAQQIVQALAAASNPLQEVRQRGEAQLDQLRSDPAQYFAACAEVLVSTEANLHGRQLVGFQIKNYLTHPACVQNAALQAAICSHAIVDTLRPIRKVASSIISRAVRENLWPAAQVVDYLRGILSERSTELAAVHGSMRALSEIVDDCIYLLDMQQLTSSIIQVTFPYLTSSQFSLSDADALEVRSKALDIMSTVLEQAGMDTTNHSFQSMQGGVLQVIDACFTNLQSPPSNAIASKCVGCVVLSLSFHEQISNELFDSMLALMKAATTADTGSDEQLRIQATEFWRAVLHFPRFAERAEETMVSMIPVLVSAMVYSELEMSMLQASAQDWEVPDKLDDIKPRHYQARVQATNDEDEDDDESDEVEDWNLRRVSASTLDDISSYFGDRILIPVLTVIDQLMQPGQSWRQLEAAMLALGAICEGCFDSLSPYLPDISTRLLQMLEAPDTHFLVVSITLWTCRRIGAYLVTDAARLRQLLSSILRSMQSPSKLVQEGASAALEEIVDMCDEGQMNAYATEIISCIVLCLGLYQLKNRVLLFEVLETVCAVLGNALCMDASAVEQLMNAVGAIWSTTPDDSPLLFSLFRCMGRVCGALGPAIQPQVEMIFDRAYRLLQLYVGQRVSTAAAGMDVDDLANEEFVVTSGDLLSGLFDALGSSLEPLVVARQPNFSQILLAMLNDADADIRQSGFSIAGDLCKSCPTQVQSMMGQFLAAALLNVATLNERTYGAISNVAWSLSNLLEYQLDLDNLPTVQAMPAAAQLFSALANIFGVGELTADMRTMAENIALFLGLMLYSDDSMESKAGCSVAVFARRFCEYVRNMKSDLPQKTTAVNGFLLAVQRHPNVVMEHLTLFFDLACSVARDGMDTQRAMRQLLLQAKNASGGLWQQRLGLYNEQMRSKLYQEYGIN